MDARPTAESKGQNKMSIDLKAHGLRVKPLEWLNLSAISFAKRFTVKESREGWYAIFEGDGSRDISPMDYDTVDEAKAWCDWHHESQVLALLEQAEGGQ